MPDAELGMGWSEKEDCLGPYPTETHCPVEEVEKHNSNKYEDNIIMNCDGEDEAAAKRLRWSSKGD